MAISIVGNVLANGTTSASISSTTLSGAGAASGDLLVLSISGIGYDPDYFIPQPSGWSNLGVGSSAGFGDGAPVFSVDTYYKEWNGTDSFTFTSGGTSNLHAKIAIIRGANNASPKDVGTTRFPSLTTAQSVTGITTTVANTVLIVDIINYKTSATSAYSAIPSGMTNSGETALALDFQYGRFKAVHQLLSSSGATGNKDFTIGSATDGVIANIYAIKEATAGGGYTGTPGLATLTLIALTPTVTINTVLTPSTATLTLTALAPTATVNTRLTPGIAALVLTAFAPTVTASNATATLITRTLMGVGL